MANRTKKPKGLRKLKRPADDGTALSVPVVPPPLPPSVELAERLRNGDTTALAEIKGNGLRALFEHGALEQYHFLLDVLEDRALGSVVVDGSLQVCGPTIAEKLQAYRLLLQGTSRMGTMGGVGASGHQTVMGLVLIPVPDHHDPAPLDPTLAILTNGKHP